MAHPSQSPQQPHHATAGNSSQNDTEMTDVRGLQSYVHQAPQQAPQHRHFPVDFTTPSRSTPTSTETAPVASMQNSNAASGSLAPFAYENQGQQRKRSLSQSMEGDSPDGRGHQSINSILNNPNSGSGEVPIEPSLLALNNELTPEQKRHHLLERRAILERETKRLKEELDHCTLELKRMDETAASDNATMLARAAVAASPVVEN